MIINNHFKSKRGDDLDSHQRRIEQAMHLHDLVRSVIENQNELNVIVIGDFNDYYNSQVMARLVENGLLTSALETVPAAEKYSYIFDGYSQLIDWILVLPEMSTQIVDAKIWHVNADYHYKLFDSEAPDHLPIRASDHDIPMVVLQLDGHLELDDNDGYKVTPTISSDKPEVTPHRHEITLMDREESNQEPEPRSKPNKQRSDGQFSPAGTERKSPSGTDGKPFKAVIIGIMLIVGTILLYGSVRKLR